MVMLEAIFEVFTRIGTWISETLPTFMELFYAEQGLTLLGVLAVTSLGISVIFLLIGIIQRFLKFRG